VEEEATNGWVIAKKNKTTTRLRRPKNHGSMFEDRVWVVLYRMGFKHLSGLTGAFLLVDAKDPNGPRNQIDVVGIDEEVAIAIECKSSRKTGKLADFTADLAKHAGLRERFSRAVREQFPSPHTRSPVFAIWTSGISVSENDEPRAKAERVALLSEGDLDYYERLLSQVGAAARFRIGGLPVYLWR
jgi:hypothetical protein